jgi:phage shock protein PspC (stress-responsive transcriptional regulator)
MLAAMNKLYRSRTDRIFLGVCGGMARYFRIDPTVFRLLIVILAIFTAIFPVLIAYLIAAFVIPIEPNGEMPVSYRRLYRSDSNRMIAGIFGGLGEMMQVDPMMLRLLAVFFCFLTGIVPLLLMYLIGWILIPLRR